MPLVKIESGKLEDENFFMNSFAEDFLGDAVWSRGDDYFSLKDGTIKRNIVHSEFMIDIRKDVSLLQKDDIFSFFIEDENNKMGLLEENTNSREYWRLIYNDNFVQVYTSQDGLSWENHGGDFCKYSGNLLQGFSVKGGSNLTLKNYKLYKSPYITIQNFKPGTIVKLYSAEREFIKEREFGADWVCELFLDYNINGYLEFYEDEVLILKSDIRELEHGDTYLYTDSSLELIYRNSILEDEVTTFSDNIEMLTLRNPENKVVSDVKLKVINDNLDTILISIDNKNYYTELQIDEIKEYEDIYVYIKIIKNVHYRNFKVNNFEIVVY